MSEEDDTEHTSLKRIQEFDVSILPRREELGEQFSFDDARTPAAEIIKLFRQIPLDYLYELPDKQLQLVKGHADAFYNQLEQILEFNPTTVESNPKSARDSLVQKLEDSYQGYFDKLYPVISYLSGRIHDFSALQTEGRAAIQGIRDQTSALSAELQTTKDSAQAILEEVRQVAAEQGVSQQAIYFSQEKDRHEYLAGIWRNCTIATAIGLGIFAFVSPIIYRKIWPTTDNEFELAQLVISKVLIFGVIAYMLVLCARNFLSHTHNAIINSQRQNALMTFKALVDAAGDDESKDVILTHAAACIFAPQDTGYTRYGATSGSSSPSLLSALQYLSRSFRQGSPSA